MSRKAGTPNRNNSKYGNVPGYERLTVDDLDDDGLYNMLRHLVMLSRMDLLNEYDKVNDCQKRLDAAVYVYEHRKRTTVAGDLRAFNRIKEAQLKLDRAKEAYERSKDFFRSSLFDSLIKDKITPDEYIDGLVNGKYETVEVEMT